MVLELLTLATLSIPAPMTTAQVQPCVWPRICSTQAQTVAQVQPCVWPRICKSQPAEAVAQVKTCVWPNVCSKPSQAVALVEGEKPLTTCSLPNKCA